MLKMALLSLIGSSAYAWPLFAANVEYCAGLYLPCKASANNSEPSHAACSCIECTSAWMDGSHAADSLICLHIAAMTHQIFISQTGS